MNSTDLKESINLTAESISQMSRDELLRCIPFVFDIDDLVEREQLKLLIEDKAEEYKCKTAVKQLCASFKQIEKTMKKDALFSKAALNNSLRLELNDSGRPKNTFDNFLLIFANDSYYSGYHFNLITNQREIHRDGETLKWRDSDEYESMRYIENKYNLRDEKTHNGALIMFFDERKYNPIIDLVESFKWDGTERCEHFLTTWAKAEDSSYVHEVSRLIFAGGINRLYNPGCKFEDVPVLVGTKQGEGKSTLIRWLAINDKYFSDGISEMDGPRSVEQLDGVWIGEMGEMLGLTKSKEQEAVKAYISRQFDKYRTPYSKTPEDRPRRCIFIGTSNKEQFLKDKTGNRRFYPVKVASDGYDLSQHEDECRDYICQCWAEAKVKYDRGEMKNFAKAELREVYKQEQESATEDDWRIGAIEAYLDDKEPGSFVCIKEIKEHLSENPDYPSELQPKEASEISQIMDRFHDWEKLKTARRTEKWGNQKGWKKRKAGGEIEKIPF